MKKDFRRILAIVGMLISGLGLMGAIMMLDTSVGLGCLGLIIYGLQMIISIELFKKK